MENSRIEKKTLENGITIELFDSIYENEMVIYCVKNGRVIKRIDAGRNLKTAMSLFNYACDFYAE